jgi:hypothetical protein
MPPPPLLSLTDMPLLELPPENNSKDASGLKSTYPHLPLLKDQDSLQTVKKDMNLTHPKELSITSSYSDQSTITLSRS